MYFLFLMNLLMHFLLSNFKNTVYGTYNIQNMLTDGVIGKTLGLQ